jgi:hypothetical protein
MSKKTRGQKNQELREDFQQRKEEAESKGYKIYKSFAAGSNSSYSFKKNGETSAYAFDSESSALRHVERKIERGDNDVFSPIGE